MVIDYVALPGAPRDELDTPCLFIDLSAMGRNIQKMASFVRKEGVACRPHKNALFLLATVVSRPAKGKAITDVGSTALSTDEGMPEVVAPGGTKLIGLDQEHGYLTLDAERLQPGDNVVILSRHGNIKFNLHEHYFGLGDGVVESVFEITGHGQFL